MDKYYLTREQTCFWSSEIPVGDPTGGPAFGEKNDPVTAGIMVGGSLLSGAMGASASKSAAGTQSAAYQAGIEEQARQFDIAQENLQPWLDTGEAALYSLSDYLGLPVTGGTTSMPVAPTKEQFMGPSTGGSGFMMPWDRNPGYYAGDPRSGSTTWVSTAPSETFDQTGYDAAMAQYEQDMAAWDAQQTARTSADTYGSLMKPFTAESLATEPGYQFGLEQGLTGIDNSALSRGLYDSGATMKALTEYNQDYAGTKYNEAFNRDMAQKTSMYNMLAGVSGTGQMTANQLATTGMNYGTNAANLMAAQGDARAAGTVGSANAWNNAISGGLNAYTNYSMMNYLNQQPPYPYAPTYMPYQPYSPSPIGH